MYKLIPILFLALFFTVGCATQKKGGVGTLKSGHTAKVRFTAYTQTEPGGSHSACGQLLTVGKVNSAAADWSRFPVGTKFQILSTGQVCQIDDYGSALVGTNTIDLYRDSRRSMRNWGVRVVDIKILEWGSKTRSLEILLPRARNRHVARMVDALRLTTPGFPRRMHYRES